MSLCNFSNSGGAVVIMVMSPPPYVHYHRPGNQAIHASLFISTHLTICIYTVDILSNGMTYIMGTCGECQMLYQKRYLYAWQNNIR